jgi:acetyl esterase/lipase
MSFPWVLDYLKSSSARTRPGWARRVHGRTPRTRRTAARLGIEQLEDRCLLSGGELSFTDPVDYAAGQNPRSVVTGDFRGIGIQDLAVANSGNNTVSIFLGNGDGTFAAGQTVAVGQTPSYVTAGDFNGDGIPDLAVADSGSNDVSILLGHGDGSFGLPHNYSVLPQGRSPQSIAVGDYNGDGIPDLAVANRASNNVSVLLGRRDGTFAPGASIAVGGSATFVVSADFDHDGRQDLAVTTVDSSPFVRGTLSILLGNGDGTFRSGQSLTTVGRGLTSMVFHDFDGDGNQDLAVTGQFTDTVSILLGTGDGTFRLDNNYQVGGQPQSIAVADFNGDGVADLVTVSLYASASVLTGNGDGTFQTTQDFWGGANPIAVAVGDFNGDGRDDLAIAENFTNQVSVLLNNGPQPEDGVTVARNIVYYDGPYANPQQQNLDVYVPPGATNSPVVFLVFGGSYRNGEKSRQAYLARTLAREGLEVVAINHRITDGSLQQVVFPAHEVDVARAFAWTYNHIAEYGGDPSKIVLLGHSSGAMLVSLLVTDRSYLAAQGLSPELIRGVIGVSAGTYDMRVQYNNPALPDLTYVFGDLEQYWNASPLKYVDGTQPPSLILYASNDMPGFAADNEAFYQALVGAGSQAEVHMIQGRNHQMIIGDDARPGDPARDLILRFIAEHTTAPARVASVVINDGSAQRSMVTSLTVTFSTVVHLDPGAFELVRQEGGVIQLNVSQAVVDGHSVDTLTFSGAGSLGGSLADGHYTLTIHGNLVHDSSGQALDGAGTGTAGSDRVDTFFRLFGDADGDGVVDEHDRALFRSAFRTRVGEAGYLWYFDFDGDGAVDGRDNGQFNRRFGHP